MIAAPVKAGRSPVATLQRWLRAAGISIHWGADGRQLLRNKFALYFEYRVAVSLAFIEPGDHLLYGASGEPHHPGDVGGVHAVFMAEVYEHVARIDHILKFILRKDLFLSYFSFKCNTFEYLCKSSDLRIYFPDFLL